MTLQEEERTLTTPGGEMTVFTARPDVEGTYPIALLFMDGIGYREQIKKNARRFAQAGYFCVAPDLYHRSGKGLTFDLTKMMSLGEDNPERGRLMQAISAVTPHNIERDTEVVLADIESDPAAELGPKVCVGYCMGARAALHIAAARDDFVAAAGIHPGALVTEQPDSPHNDLKQVSGELYFAFAENDRSATPENIDAFRREMESDGVRGEVERLAGTSHGFAMADLPVYDEGACERHFEKTLELWRRNLEPSRAG